MKRSYRIVFSGPAGAGKTTAVAVLGDATAICAGSVVTATIEERRAEADAAKDHGRLCLPDRTEIHLYSTPGPEAPDSRWHALVEDAIGLVLLLDNSRPDPMEDLRSFVEAFREFIDRSGLVVGVTHTDVRSVPAPEDYHRQLAAIGLQDKPLFEVDARRRRDVSMLVETLLCTRVGGIDEA